MTEVLNQQNNFQVKEIPVEIDYDSINIVSEWIYNCLNDNC